MRGLPVDVVTISILLAAAFLVGFLSSMVGIGGGSFIVPLLVLGGFVPTTQVAVGTSLVAVAVTGFSSSIQYVRKRAAQWKLALALVPGLLVGSEAGARATLLVSSDQLAGIFGIVLLYTGLLLLTGRKPTDLPWRRPAVPDAQAPPKQAPTGGAAALAATAVGFVAGVSSGLLGIGGGIVIVPGLVLAFNIPLIQAVATSLLAFTPTSAYAAFRHWTFGNVDLLLALPVAIGVFAGALAGPALALKTPEKRLRQLFGIVLIYAAATLIWTATRPG